MKPVYQTRYGERRGENEKGGNCFQAALASLFELELEDVPDFCNIYPLEGDEWWYEYIKWLNKRGFSVLPVNLNASSLSLESEEFRGAVLLVQGKNKNGVQHCVLYQDGRSVHNPNKKCTGITPEFIDVIFPLNPNNGSRPVKTQ